MFRFTPVAAGLAAGLALVVTPAVAVAAPARGCPPPFSLLTYEEQVALAMQVSGLDRADAIEQLVQPTIDKIDLNGDTSLCFAFQNPAKGLPNVVDNVAATG